MTTTTNTLTREAAEHGLHEAETHHARLLERISRGDASVKPADLSDAEHRLELARLRRQAVEGLEAELAEAERLEKIEALRARANSGALRDKTSRVVQAYDQAVKALAALRSAAQDQQAELTAIARELRQLGELPPSVEVERYSGTLHSMTVDGVTWSVGKDLEQRLAVAAAVDAGVPRHFLRDAAASGNTSNPIERFREAAAAEVDPDALAPGVFVTVRTTAAHPRKARGLTEHMRWSIARREIERGYVELVEPEPSASDEGDAFAGE